MKVPASKISLPIPDLDDKTFEELFIEARALILRYAPEWTNHNLSDPGITLIDLFAWLTEMEIYTLNRINDRNILKFLKLLGDVPKAPKPATVNLEFSLEEYRSQSVEIKKGTQASTVNPTSNEQLVFETDSDLIVSNIKIARIFSSDTERFAEQTYNNAANSSSYFAFGNKALINSEFYIAFSAEKGFPENDISLLFSIYQAELPIIPEMENQAAEIIPSAKLEWQFKGNSPEWQLLRVKEDTTAALTRNGKIRFQGNNQFKKATIKDIISGAINSTDSYYWIRARVKKAGYEIPPRIDSIFVNTVSATHVRAINDEFISVERISRRGLPLQTISLLHKPVLAKSLVLKVYEEDKTWYQWQEVSDFDASKPIDRHYVIDLQTGEIQFGDGINGQIPPEVDMLGGKSNIIAEHYKVGGGINGNVKSDTILTLLTPDINAKVKNPRAASGGTDMETLEVAQHRIRKDLKRPFRAVHFKDFETLAMHTPGLRLQRVKVLPLYHPNYPGIKMPGSITVIVVPYVLSNLVDITVPKPSEGFLQTVTNFLEPRCLLTTQLHVIAPEFIKIDLDINLEIDPRKSTASMKVEIDKVLRKFLNPNSDEQGNQGWLFGRAVYKSEIYKILQDIEGVVCVKKVSLSTGNCRAIKINGNILIPKTGLVYLGKCVSKFNEGNNS